MQNPRKHKNRLLLTLERISKREGCNGNRTTCFLEKVIAQTSVKPSTTEGT
jgi:hypothetical protein